MPPKGILRNTYIEKVALGRRFIKFAGNLPLYEASAKLVSDFILHSCRESTANRANRDRKNLLSFWNWCQRVLDHPSNPVSNCDRLPHKRAAQYVPME